MNKYSSFFSLLLVAACAVITSCNQDVLVTQKTPEADAAHRQKLEFYLDVETRGEEVTLQNLDTIYVFGTYMKDGVRQSCFSTKDYEYGFVPFIRSVKKAPGEYSYDIPADHYYRPEIDMYWEEEWPETCEFLALNVKPNLPFYGEYNGETTEDPEVEGGTVEKSYARMKQYAGDNTFTVINFDQPPLVKDQIDVVVAHTTDATKEGSRYGVPLHFYHRFAAFDIKFRQSVISDYKINIYAVDVVQKAFGDFWYDQRTGRYTWHNYTTDEKGSIITSPNGSPLQVTNVPQRLNNDKPDAYLIASNPDPIYSPKTDDDMFKFQTLENGQYRPSIYLKLYLTVEDKDGNVIYPTAEDLKNPLRNKENVTSMVAEKTDYDFWDKIGVSYISFGMDMVVKMGERYSMTVDLSYGVGYFNPDDEGGKDPNGGNAVLNRPIGANVTIEDFINDDGIGVIIPNNTTFGDEPEDD